MRNVLAILLVVGCATRVEPSPAPVEPPRTGALGDARPADVALPNVGEFVLVRGGERLFARPAAASPSITLPADPDPFIGPIPAKAIAIADGFVEVEMLDEDADSHCGVSGTYADALRGFVRASALADVTTTSSRVGLENGVELEVPAGMAVDDAGGTIESDGERFEIAIDPSVVGRSYAAANGRCLDGFGDNLTASATVPPTFATGLVGPARVPAWFETGEPLGAVASPREDELGPADPDHPSRRCFAFSTVSGSQDDASVCIEPRERAPVPVSLVGEGKHHVEGPLDADIVRRIVRAHVNEIRHCYNQGLLRDPTLKGTVTLSFEVGAKGKVNRARVDAATLPDAAVGECMTKAVTRWTFPEPTGGKTTKITYPFKFLPP